MEYHAPSVGHGGEGKAEDGQHYEAVLIDWDLAIKGDTPIHTQRSGTVMTKELMKMKSGGFAVYGEEKLPRSHR